MKKTALFFGLTLLSFISTAQLIEREFAFPEDDYGKAVIQTSDFGYVIAGQIKNEITGQDNGLIFKLDESGDTLWRKVFHQIGGTQTTFSNVVETADQGIVIVGNTTKYNAPDPGNVTSMLVIKFSSDGDIVWNTSFANPGEMLWNTAYGLNIQAYPDSGVVVSGNISSNTCGGSVLMRLDKNGGQIWSKNYHAAGSGEGIAVLPDGEIYFTGSLVQESTYYAHLTKVNPENGDHIFTRRYGMDGSILGRELMYLNGHLYLAGHFYDATDNSLFLIKLDDTEMHSPVWAKFIGDNMLTHLMGATSIGNNIAIGGVNMTVFDTYIVTFNEEGELEHEYQYGDEFIEIRALNATSDNQLIATGKVGGSNENTYFGLTDPLTISFCASKTPSTVISDVDAVVTTPTLYTAPSPIVFPIHIEVPQLQPLEIIDFCGVSSISEEDNAETNTLEIYPNPTNDQFYISTGGFNQNIGAYLLDADGRLVMELDPNGLNAGISIAHLESGIYFIRIQDENRVYFGTIIKE